MLLLNLPLCLRGEKCILPQNRKSRRQCQRDFGYDTFGLTKYPLGYLRLSLTGSSVVYAIVRRDPSRNFAFLLHLPSYLHYELFKGNVNQPQLNINASAFPTGKFAHTIANRVSVFPSTSHLIVN